MMRHLIIGYVVTLFQITLKHQAPVIGISIVDGTYYPLPLALEVQNGRAKAPDMSGNHKLLVISEEQFKV